MTAAALYTLPLPKGDPDSIVYRRAALHSAPVVVTVATPTPAPLRTRAEWLAADAAERAAAAIAVREAPAPVETPADPAAALEPLPVGFTSLQLREHMRAAFPGVEVSAVSATKRPQGVYVLSHPIVLPERTGRTGRYLGGCTVHKLFIACPSRSSANIWRDTAAHWCPACIG